MLLQSEFGKDALNIGVQYLLCALVAEERRDDGNKTLNDQGVAVSSEGEDRLLRPDRCRRIVVISHTCETQPRTLLLV